MDIHALIPILRGAMVNGDEANQKILSDLEGEIDALLNDQAKSTKELIRGMLRVMKIQNPFLVQSLADHGRTMTMWMTYRYMAWGVSGLGLMLLGLMWGIFTGKVELIFK